MAPWCYSKIRFYCIGRSCHRQHQQQPKLSSSNSIRVAHDDLDVDIDVDEEDFFNPNLGGIGGSVGVGGAVSAKITVDVTVEFERESIYKTKIEETPTTTTANGLWVSLTMKRRLK